MRLLLIWLVNALSLLAVAYLLPSVSVASFTVAVVTAFLLAIVTVAAPLHARVADHQLAAVEGGGAFAVRHTVAHGSTSCGIMQLWK